MSSNWFCALLLGAALCHIGQAGFRCSVLGEAACQATCSLLKWDFSRIGYCDPENECICSPVKETFFSRLNVTGWVRSQVQTFKDNVNPSRCAISEGFCDTTCKVLLRKEGTCSADMTDCSCSDEKLSISEFALCSHDGACRVYCQSKSKNFHTGKCAGPNGRTCKCYDIDEHEFDPEDYDEDEDEEEDAERFAPEDFNPEFDLPPEGGELDPNDQVELLKRGKLRK